MTTNQNGQNKNTIEDISFDELQALQLQRMKSTLVHAYQNSAFYKIQFDNAGVHPDDLITLADLAKFPFTVKADLRDNYPFNLFATPMEDIVRIHASSGTTGKPTVVGYTQNDIDMWADVVARSLKSAGVTKKDIVHVAYGYGLFTGGLGAHYGAEKLGCTVIPMSGGQTEKQVQLIKDFDPDVIMVTPSYALNLADELDRQGIDPKTLKLRVGIFGAEPWTNAMRDEIEKRLDIQAVDIYGLSEVIGPGVAMENIQTKDGPTIWEDHFYPEIINPETGEVLPDGEEGELVFTSLTKEALPIIRYRTRDLTRLLTGTSCVMRRMDRITGRSDDMLIIRGVNVFPTQIEEQILSFENLAPHYLIEVCKEGNLDKVIIKIEANKKLSENERELVTKELQHKIKVMVGISSVIIMEPMGSLPRSEGKAKRVIDKRLFPSFIDSVKRCLTEPEFIHNFYQRFITNNEQAEKMFALTDMKNQQSMLKNSLMLMMTTSIESFEVKVHLEMIGKSHSRSGHNISPELYTHWLDCLIDSAREVDKLFDLSIEQAWRKTLQHGIDKMIAMY
jgi:phenylacetate-CoA ligase